MLENKVLRITLLASVIIHAAILLQNPNFNFFAKLPKSNRLELSYVREIPQEKKEVIKEEQPRGVLRKTILSSVSGSKATVRKINPPPFIDREQIFKKITANPAAGPDFAKPDFAKPILMKPEAAAGKKVVNMPPLDLEKIDNPSYVSYYEIVRAKIRRSAYQRYSKTETGEVYLSFIITKEGFLKEIKLMEERSSTDLYLREIAMRSIQDASPFPVFPKELDYPQLSFNVVISFEVE